MTAIPNVDAIARDATWLPHRYDPGHDSVHFVKVTREAHRAATFLTDDHLPTSSEPAVVRRAEAIAEASPPAPLHFIFHSAFCGSTLLARAFDIEGVAMGLKEPVILNDLVGWRQRGGERAQIARALDHSLALLSRPFAPGEAVIVKPSNVVNGLIPVMMTMRPAAKALLLYAPLRVYLRSIAKKGMWGRLWVRDLLVKLAKEGLVGFDFTTEDYLRQTDLQAAAVGWLAQHALFLRLVEKFGPDRVRMLDSEMLMARREESLGALVRHYGLPLDTKDVEAILGGPAFTRHSKTGGAFDVEGRAAEHREAEAAHREEVDKVAIWAEAIAKQAGLPLEPAAPLLP